MRRYSLSTAALLVLAGSGIGALAQQQTESVAVDRFILQQRLRDDELQKERQGVAPLESLLDWQVGGWLSYYFFDFNDGIQSQRIEQRPELAVWTRLRIDNGAHEIFARMRLDYYYFDPGDQYERQEDWVGPFWDQLWYQIDIGRAFRLNKPSDPLQMKVRVGRQTVTFGTGYVLDTPMDAVLTDLRLGDVRVQGLVGKSITNLPNIDTSQAVHSHSDRMFYGVQLSYEHWQHHVPFVYALWNQDYTRPWPHTQWLQSYNYNSFYLGTGMRGSIVHNLNYWVEGVFEGGGSYGDQAFDRQDYIQAWASDIGIEKLFDVPTRPRASFEYMFASGDSDRLLSPTNALGGNKPGTPDTSFVGFGFRDTGIDSSLIMSNLNVWRVGAAFAPLDRYEFFRDLEVGTNWFLYHKNQSRGAISDPTATQFAGYVGWEMDYFINWRLASDLSWTIRWGTFFPGDAYADQAARSFLMTGVTWSF